MNSRDTTILHITMPLCSLLDLSEEMANTNFAKYFPFLMLRFTKHFSSFYLKQNLVLNSLPFKEKEVKEKEERARAKCTAR